MPAEVQREAGWVFDRDYAAPIADRRRGREATRRRFAALTA